MDSRAKMDIILKHLFKITSAYSEYAHKNNTTYNRLMILYAIKEVPNCTQKHIVECWGVPKQTVNTVVKRLKKDGMLELIKVVGKREKVISLTESGYKYTANVVNNIIDFEDSAISVLSDDEFKRLDNYMERFAEKFDMEVSTYEYSN